MPNFDILGQYDLLTIPPLSVGLVSSRFVALDWATEWLHDKRIDANPATCKYLWSIGQDLNLRFYSFADCCFGPLSHRCISCSWSG